MDTICGRCASDFVRQSPRLTSLIDVLVWVAHLTLDKSKKHEREYTHLRMKNVENPFKPRKGLLPFSQPRSATIHCALSRSRIRSGSSSGVTSTPCTRYRGRSCSILCALSNTTRRRRSKSKPELTLSAYDYRPHPGLSYSCLRTRLSTGINSGHQINARPHLSRPRRSFGSDESAIPPLVRGERRHRSQSVAKADWEC